MGHRLYTAQYKTGIVLEVLQGEKELGEIAAENNLNPNMSRNMDAEGAIAVVYKRKSGGCGLICDDGEN